MSGVWGGWLRRMRKGEASEQKIAPEFAHPGDQEVAAATIDEADEPAVSLDEAPTSPELLGTLQEQEATEKDQEEATGSVSDPFELLASGRLAKAQAASRTTGAHDEVVGLIDAVATGETLLREAGLQIRADAAGLLKGVMLAPAAAISGPTTSGSTGHDLVVVFGGDGGGFSIPKTLLDPARPHLLFVADRANALAMLGIPRLGKSYDDCLIALLAIIRKVGATRVFCLGAGNAAYSALRFGLDLGADGVLALGTLTSLSLDEAPAGRCAPERFTQLLRLADALGTDLHQAYATAQQRPGVILCNTAAGTAPGDGFDSLEGVTLRQAPEWAGADLLAWAEAEGRLAPMLREAMACEAVFNKKTRGKAARAVS